MLKADDLGIEIPLVADLPWLPESYLEGLKDDRPVTHGKVEIEDQDVLAVMTEGEPCRAVETALAKYQELTGEGRACHESMCLVQMRLGRGVLVGIFRREGTLVHTPRIGEDGYIPPKVGHDGPAQVQMMTKEQLAARVNVRYHVQDLILDKEKTKEKGEKAYRPVEALVPPATIQTVYEAAGMDEGTPNVRELHGVTHTPVLRPDGSVLHEPGYDTSTRMLYLPDPGLVVPPIPDEPTADDIKQARELILFLTEEFPWVSEDHRATWNGLFMLPALRPIIRPPYPFGVITAPNKGSGKGFLAGMIRDTHGGVMRSGSPVMPRS
jgi:hypothetical protein